MKSDKTGNRTTLILAIATVVLFGAAAVAWMVQKPAEAQIEITVYKSPTCGCCTKWIDHLRDNGFKVTAVNRSDLPSIKSRLGVRPDVASCHTAVVGDYVVEGHVPADVVKRLLKEHPEVRGIAVPGMPIGSPGMEGPNPQPYNIVTFDARGRTSVYATR